MNKLIGEKKKDILWSMCIGNTEYPIVFLENDNTYNLVKSVKKSCRKETSSFNSEFPQIIYHGFPYLSQK